MRSIRPEPVGQADTATFSSASVASIALALPPDVRELFVYYRVPPASIAAAHAAVTAAQAVLRAAHPGLVARLLRRDGDDAARPASTWMEAYARPTAPRGVDAVLQSAIESACTPLLALIDGPRHAEAFDADVPAAGSG